MPGFAASANRCTALAASAQALLDATPAATRGELAAGLDRVAAIPADSDAQVAERLLALSQATLGKPYAWNPIGEGPGHLDPDPPFDLQRYDCMTWLETVIALARANCLDDVFDELSALRYGRQAPSFETRTHFVSVDWLPAVEAAGALLPAPAPVPMHTVTALIDKPQWFARLGRNRMYRHLMGAAPGDARRRLDTWGATLAPVPATLKVMSAGALIDWAERSAAMPAPERLPAASVLLILRPDAPFNQSVGGGDPVSHVGLLVPTSEPAATRWVLRSASSEARGVADVPLRSALRTTPKQGRVQGVAVWTVRARRASR